MNRPLPDPQHNEAPTPSVSRWRWIDNPGFALTITLALSALSREMIEGEWFARIEKDYVVILWSIGITLDRLMLHAGVVPFAVLFFYPIVLQLGLRRILLWWILSSIGGIMGFLLIFFWGSLFWPPWNFMEEMLSQALPGFAMIGRRTRPWLALLASPVYALILHRLTTHVHVTLDTILLTALTLPYAAILFFGTDRIPKRSTTMTTND